MINYVSVYHEAGSYILIGPMGIEFYPTQEQVHSRLGQLNARRLYQDERSQNASVVGSYGIPSAQAVK